ANLKLVTCRFLSGIGLRLPEHLRMFYFLGLSQRAAQAYVPQVYSGRVALLKTRISPHDYGSRWTRLVSGEFTTYELPGRHLDVIKGPYVGCWGKQVRACLQKVEEVAERSSTGTKIFA